MAIREGKWRCTYCSVVNRGRDLACTGCGATREKDVTFFLEEDAPEVTEEALLRQAVSGPDWLCAFCGTSSPADEQRCRNCGAERGTSPSRPIVDHLAVPAGSHLASLTSPPVPPSSRRTTGVGRGCALLFLVLLAVLAFLGYRACRKTEERLAVSGFEWRREIAVEAYRTVRETAWHGEVPSGARVLHRSREVHHTERERVGTERVKVGTRDRGNGFFEDVIEDRPVHRSRDVYRDRISYEIERWVPDRTARASGQDQSPRWPDAHAGPREREGARSASYIVALRGQREYRLELPEEQWSALRSGQSVRAAIRGGREVLSIQ